MDDRAKRIVDTAVELAERDGYDAVRLREVAATADVALGTVYKRFSSKEEILIAALQQESDRVMSKLAKKIIPGEGAVERTVHLFGVVTRGLLRRPNLARALLRSVASGDHNVIDRVAGFHAMITGLTIAAVTGEAAKDEIDTIGDVDNNDLDIASIIEHVWFSALVGWAGGLHDEEHVLAQLKTAAQLLLKDRR